MQTRHSKENRSTGNCPWISGGRGRGRKPYWQEKLCNLKDDLRTSSDGCSQLLSVGRLGIKKLILTFLQILLLLKSNNSFLIVELDKDFGRDQQTE